MENDNKNEQKLRELVIKWTSHFRWRRDFFEWQKERIWQENYQEVEIVNGFGEKSLS